LNFPNIVKPAHKKFRTLELFLEQSGFFVFCGDGFGERVEFGERLGFRVAFRRNRADDFGINRSGTSSPLFRLLEAFVLCT